MNVILACSHQTPFLAFLQLPMEDDIDLSDVDLDELEKDEL